MLGVFAEFERAIIQERIHAGLARAREKAPRAGNRLVGRGSTQRKRRQSAQRWRAVKAFSKPPASSKPVLAWCSGSKPRWREPMRPMREVNSHMLTEQTFPSPLHEWGAFETPFLI